MGNLRGRLSARPGSWPNLSHLLAGLALTVTDLYPLIYHQASKLTKLWLVVLISTSTYESILLLIGSEKKQMGAAELGRDISASRRRVVASSPRRRRRKSNKLDEYQYYVRCDGRHLSLPNDWDDDAYEALIQDWFDL